ncbi:MAG: hypothetical protein CL583_07360 [Alteromonadaceae bacterium]|nr:hypothetical protein [Alteromonadaceae bacterium]|tara:strand:- start:6595 stop:7170 length:576 start_codon:yes stop_codon:yes gene_type:complete
MAFSDSVWWTRKSRIQAEKRLLANSFQAQLLLLWYSFFAVCASLYYAQLDQATDSYGIAWIAFSVLILAMSGFISGLSFKERASLIKECYETLNDLYQRATVEGAETDVLAKEYTQILSVCENHSDRDYYIAMCEAQLTHDPDKLDRHPTKYIWFLFLWYRVSRVVFLSVFYSLPVIIFIGLHCYDLAGKL